MAEKVAVCSASKLISKILLNCRRIMKNIIIHPAGQIASNHMKSVPGTKHYGVQIVPMVLSGQVGSRCLNFVHVPLHGADQHPDDAFSQANRPGYSTVEGGPLLLLPYRVCSAGPGARAYSFHQTIASVTKVLVLVAVSICKPTSPFFSHQITCWTEGSFQFHLLKPRCHFQPIATTPPDSAVSDRSLPQGKCGRQGHSLRDAHRSTSCDL